MASPEKLTIEVEDGREKAVVAQFNPERFTLSKAAQFAEVAIPGLDSPVLQFVRGQNERISFELFFDTTSHGIAGDDVKDVRDLTAPVYHLLKIRKETHAPPRCRLRWGHAGKIFSFGSSLDARCVLESVSEEFSLFSPSGIPLRARLTVTFREYKTVEEQVGETVKHSADRTRDYDVRSGQTLDLIAYLHYGDPGAWRAIADANNIDDPTRIAPGSRLRIPRLVGAGTPGGRSASGSRI